MYAGVDIGGSKTLVAVFDDAGNMRERYKFPTPKNYEDFLIEFTKTVASFTTKDFAAAAVGLPGRLDRGHGICLSLNNLPWHKVPIQADCEKIFDCPVVIENDANLAAISEAMLHKDYKTVLYVTISTGIGTGVIHNQKLDETLIDSEGGQVVVPYKDKLQNWEDFASGEAIFKQFGRKASEIKDPADWKIIARNISIGLFENMTIVQPNLVIIGGSIGTYFPKYEKLLEAELQKYAVPVTTIPKIIGATRPEEAVVYGCYELARSTYGKDH